MTFESFCFHGQNNIGKKRTFFARCKYILNSFRLIMYHLVSTAYYYIIMYIYLVYVFVFVRIRTHTNTRMHVFISVQNYLMGFDLYWNFIFLYLIFFYLNLFVTFIYLIIFFKYCFYFFGAYTPRHFCNFCNF